MSATPPTADASLSTGVHWGRETYAAGSGTLAVLAVVLSLGLLAYAALGTAGPGLGIPASFAGIVIGGLVYAALSRGGMPAACPSSATVLLFAGLVAQVGQDASFRIDQPVSVAELLALTAGAVVVMGVIQLALGALGLARLGSFVPQPVLAGFMNGVAALIFLAQVPLVLGWPAATGPAQGWAASLPLSQPGPLLLAAVTAGCVWLAPKFLPRWPASLVGLLAGVAVSAALFASWPAWPQGALVGAVTPEFARPTALAPWLNGDAAASGLLGRHLGAMLVTGLLMALIGSLECVLNGLVIDQELDRRTDASRELRVLGLANIAGGLFAGLPLVLLLARARPTLWAGGRTRWSVAIGCVMLAGVAVLATPWLAALPRAVLAGIMITIAVALIDRWTRQMLAQWRVGPRTAELQLSLLVTGVVCLVTITLGFVTGVLLGVLLAMLMFIRSMNRSLLRARYSAAASPSRRIYGASQEALLQAERRRIVVIELEGALFFGSADRLAAEAEALPPDTHTLVLDLRRLTTIDASGAATLQRMARRVAGRGIALRLAGIAQAGRHDLALRAFGQGGGAEAWHGDVDHAVEAAEAQLLAESHVPAVPSAVALAATDLFRGLGAAQAERLAARLEPRTLQPGERLFVEGDAGDRLYVITAGSVTVRSRAAATQGSQQRFSSLSPGMMLGETAMLDGKGRTADAVADPGAGPTQVHMLTTEALQALQAEDAALAAQLYRNIAQHLAERLRSAASVWRATSG